MTDKKRDKPAKEKKEKEKPVRVQFGKDLTNQAIVGAITALQDYWALGHPQKAHELYPRVYDQSGKRIKND